ncbi:hypothetical protein C0J50_15172 [Silurus asotus]|uniref:Saposin B-type domain-containing protein n=1 Tax=Silurus asotus TaxID=30991 RepID=A0AAD5AYF1_SILAS|nr:hypothetical protein C0J50_15172 [Silurus asotus]
MPSAPAVCFFLLSCFLTSGYAGIIGSHPPPLKTSNLSTDLILGSFKEICNRLPSGRALNDCLNFMEKYLPIVVEGFVKLTAHKEGEICMVLGLCVDQREHQAPELLGVNLQKAGFLQVQPSTGTSHELQISPQCTFCLFFIRKLEDLLPKERTEESVVKLMERICDYLPEHYKEQCNDMVEKYGKQIIDFLLSSATPHTICTLLHMCFGQDTPVIVPSACKTCKNLMILTQTHLGQNASETQMTSVLWKTCQRHPNTLPGCEPFIQSHFTALVNILSKRDEAVNACQVISNVQ